MTFRKNAVLSAMVLACALPWQPLWAAQAPASSTDQAKPASNAKAGQDDDIEQIVVTGAAGRGLRRTETSYSVTTLSNAEIERQAPKSTADLFKSTPGIWVESSGGEGGANIFVRGFASSGDAEFTTVQIDGMPIYPPSTLSFLENSTLFRLDETVERVEGLRGGPNPVFSNGQPGVTFNFIQKKGTEVPEGLVKTTFSDYGSRRLDLYYGGPLSKDWFISMGGFYRTSDGIRDTQYPADQGGQFSVKLTHELDNGELNLWARKTRDKNVWLLPIPLIQTAGGNIKAFPGFDGGSDTLYGSDTRLADLEVGPGQYIRRDMQDGRGINIGLVGGSLDLDLDNGWSLLEKFSFMSGDADSMGLVPATTPVTAKEYLDAKLAEANDGGIIQGAAGGAANTGSFSYSGSGEAMTDLNQQVMTAGWWSVQKQLKSFTNDVRIIKELNDQHTVTVGVYYADYSSDDLWYLGNNQLITAEPNAKRLDLVLDNGVKATHNGFEGAPFFDVNASYNGRNTALFLAEQWRVTDRFKLDFGFRVENQKVDGTLENNDTGVDLDNDPTTLYDNNAAVLNGSFRSIDFDRTETAWTAGANYLLNDAGDTSVFARVNSGFKMPQFDNLRDGVTNTQDIDQYELGFKHMGSRYSAYATLFYTDFSGLPFQNFIDGQNVVRIGGATAKGLELEGNVAVTDSFAVAITSTYQDAKLKDFGENTDHQVMRQPKWQVRLTPSYDVDFAWGWVSFYGTYSYVGKRYSDLENQQVLPSFEKLDAGVVANIGDHIKVQLVGDNLTDKLALTEGNPRALGSGASGDGVILARPILGRSFRLSLSYAF